MRGALTPCKQYRFSDAAEELIRLKRQEAAKDFIKSVHMAYKYQHTGQKFKGQYINFFGLSKLSINLRMIIQLLVEILILIFIHVHVCSS